MAAIGGFQKSDLVRFAVNISSFQAIHFSVIDSVWEAEGFVDFRNLDRHNSQGTNKRLEDCA
jgi:hypothetical protein